MTTRTRFNFLIPLPWLLKVVFWAVILIWGTAEIVAHASPAALLWPLGLGAAFAWFTGALRR